MPEFDAGSDVQDLYDLASAFLEIRNQRLYERQSARRVELETIIERAKPGAIRFVSGFCQTTEGSCN